MSVEAITDAILEYTYDKLNDSPETEEEKKIRYLNKRKIKPTKEQPEKPTKIKKSRLQPLRSTKLVKTT